ncbi:alpha-amylase family glycosyl hydrolase [Exiguobacterium sp.]|uniref:alpha-amylase family glycosyl hydrolase n=1 Tax=Exiguobacterium sp. TaxID=44751 RepID=UPI00263B884A|nr:alpha-amylase family glycosyl hydrolase [Exiguobacterium sp.]MCC5893640.1 Ig-like domain-containing protein [Exiguobacterium sp.]
MKNKTARRTSTLLLSSVLLIQTGVPVNVLAEPTAVSIDGIKSDWANVPALATSPTAGWQGFDLGDLYMQNDAKHLYFYVDAKNVPNWGDNGQYINIALQVNDEDSGVNTNPLGYPFNFSQTDKKPQYHILLRVDGDAAIKEAAIYESGKSTPLANLNNLNGASFALDRTKGFEGKIPLSLLGLTNNDQLRVLTVLSGNNAGEHGAFDTIPSNPANKLADSWNVAASPSVQSVYSPAYTLSGVETVSQLEVTTVVPANQSADVTLDAPITWTFNEPVTVDASQVQFMNGESAVPFRVETSGATVTVTPTEKLLLGETYEATIPAGAVKGKLSNTTLPALTTSFKTITEVADPWKTQRYIEMTYVRADGNYTDWNLWTWSTGAKDGQVDPYKVTENGAVFRIPVGKDATNVGFVIRKGTDWAVKDGYGEDRYVKLGTDRITKVVVESGKGVFHQVPTIQGPVFENGNITFFYRDKELYEAGTLAQIEQVALKVNGVTYPMAYEANNEWFRHTIQLPEGKHDYTFLVTKDGVTTEVKDPYFEASSIEYRRPNVKLTSSVSPKAISSRENAVVHVKPTLPKGVTLRELYIDARPLGGPAKLAIDPALNKQTIAVKDTVKPGNKTLTVQAIDQYGNVHKTTTSVNVLPVSMKDKQEFDWDEARIYFMLTDRFYDGDKTNNNPNGEYYDLDHPESYHGGDFAGITKKLDYLDKLGINTIWITPIVDNIDWDLRYGKDGSQYGYHGYWAKNFEKLDEHLGDMQAFHRLIDAANDRGIKIMVDVVLNHPGYGMEPGAEETGATNFPTDKERNVFDGMIRTNPVDGDDLKMSLSGLPDFKTEETAVREQLVKWQTDWIKRSKTKKGNTIDYFRVDTVKHVDSTTWKSFKNELTAIKPDFKMIGEHYGASVNNTGGYLHSGQMDSLLDFDFKYQAESFVNGNIDGVESALQYRNMQLSNEATLGQFLSSHDEDGFLISRAGGDEGKHMVAASLQMTAKGQPVIYYGEEIGQSGKHAGDMDKGEFNENRYDFDWKRVTGEGKAMHTHYQKLLNIRADYSKVFSKGTREVVAGGSSTGYSIFERTYGKQAILVGLNTKETTQKATFQTKYKHKTVLVDRYSGRSYIVQPDGKVTVQLPAQDQGGTVILVKK